MNHIPQPRTRVSACRFKRTETSDYERGVMLGHGDIIVDLNKKVVKKVWNYDETPDEGCFTVGPVDPPISFPMFPSKPRHSLRA